MSPTGERRDEGGNIRTRQNPLGPQERQTRIDRAGGAVHTDVTPRQECPTKGHTGKYVDAKLVKVSLDLTLRTRINRSHMSCKNIKLGDIPIIANSLKCGTTRAVKTLNSILGFTEFDRSSRNKIRNFSTFPKEFRVEEHKEKILIEFSLPDFISVANLLHLDVETNEQNLCNSIFKALTNLDEFQLTLNNSEASFSEGENVVSKTHHVRQEFFIGRDRPALPFSTSGQ
ncbi:uncharacterized protein LOC105457711 [Trichonephila clavipes]|nr:uncharacterized protein LOC105457711 [Trichonephila clavipes]